MTAKKKATGLLSLRLPTKDRDQLESEKYTSSGETNYSETSTALHPLDLLPPLVSTAPFWSKAELHRCGVFLGFFFYGRQLCHRGKCRFSQLA